MPGMACRRARLPVCAAHLDALGKRIGTRVGVLRATRGQACATCALQGVGHAAQHAPPVLLAAGRIGRCYHGGVQCSSAICTAVALPRKSEWSENLCAGLRVVQRQRVLLLSTQSVPWASQPCERRAFDAGLAGPLREQRAAAGAGRSRCSLHCHCQLELEGVQQP